MVFEKAGIRGTGIWTKGQGEKHGSHAGKERWQLMQTGASMEIHGHPQNVKQLFSRPETWKYHSSLPNDRSSMDWESIETCHWVPRRFARCHQNIKTSAPKDWCVNKGKGNDIHWHEIMNYFIILTTWWVLFLISVTPNYIFFFIRVLVCYSKWEMLETGICHLTLCHELITQDIFT